MMLMSLDQATLADIALRADRFRDDKQWLSAAFLYGELLENGPSSTHSWVQYAHMLKEAELFEEAIRAYEFAISFDGTEPDPRLHLAHLLKRLNRIADALEAFRALSALPDAPPVEQEIRGLHVTVMQAEPKTPSVFASTRKSPETSACLAGFSRLERREQARLAGLAARNRELDHKAALSEMSAVEIVRRATERPLRARLDPKAHMVIRDGSYVSTTKNPQFSIVIEGEQLHRGWFVIEVEIFGKGMAFAPILYVEHRAEWSRCSTYHLKPMGEGRFQAIGLIEDEVLRLRLDPADCEGAFGIKTFSLRQIGLVGSFRRAHRVDREAARAAFLQVRTHKSIKQFARDLAGILNYHGPDDYEKWIAKYDAPTQEDLARYRRAVDRWQNRPLISIVVSVDEQNFSLFEETLRSLQEQVYRNWQLHLVVSADAAKEKQDEVNSRTEGDARIMPVFAGDDLTAKTVLEAIQGRFVLFMEAGDALASTGLYRLVEHHVVKPLSKLIYSDEDSIEHGLRHSPLFKPDWDPDYFYASNYVGQSVLFEAELARASCPFAARFQDLDVHDLVLRASEILSLDEITHIPRVLYHRYGSSQACAEAVLPYPVTGSRTQAIKESLARQGRQADLVTMSSGLCRVLWPVPEPAPLVTLIIPTRDYADLLQGCIGSILDITGYPAFEIIIVDNGSVEPKTLDYFDSLRTRENIRILEAPGPFNFSRLNNLAVEQARGSIVALINNDIVVTDRDWLREMVSQAVRPEIGAVGARLLYKTGHIQHAGIVCGIGLVAAHPHKFRAPDDPGYMGRIFASQSLSAVTAACLVVEKTKYRQAGGMDEDNLRVAFNDVDFCLKLDAAGYRNIYTPYATLIHLESISRGLDMSPEKANRYKGEAAFMQRKWGDKVKRDRFYNVNLTTDREDFSIGI
jgi:O-antigen biosynthesis protein